jgi:hypothetical protein
MPSASSPRTANSVAFRCEEGRERFRRDGQWHDLIVMSLLEGELLDD